MLKEKIFSIVDHMTDNHVFEENTEHKKCEHPPLPDDGIRTRPWLKTGSKVLLVKLCLAKVAAPVKAGMRHVHMGQSLPPNSIMVFFWWSKDEIFIWLEWLTSDQSLGQSFLCQNLSLVYDMILHTNFDQAIKKVRKAIEGKDGSRAADLPMMCGFTHTGDIGMAKLKSHHLVNIF